MRERLQRKLSFSNVVAVIALFVALGGTVYAAGKISGRQIKPNSIPGNRIKQGTLTGTQIKSSTLNQVPSASNADKLGGKDPGGFQQRVRWAIVDDGGTVLGQSGGITNSAHNPPSCTPGCDFLDFGSSQAGKAIIVTPAGVYGGIHTNVAALCGGTGNPGGTNCSVADDVSHILVISTSSAGTAANGGYYIAVVG